MLRYVLRNQDMEGFPCPSGFPPVLHRLLAARGIASREAAEAFLSPSARDLHDPMGLSDMDRAAARIRLAMEKGEVICVYGDYDVDGVCASAILSGWLKSQGADARVYLPSRHHEGYGLNEAAIRQIAGWAQLLVTVDCGVTSVALVALAVELGLSVIVTDHHQPTRDEAGAPVLPGCPVVNPLLNGYPFPSLCGAGVAWKLVWALGGEGAAMPYVDVAALATVADVVPLVGENRVIVKLGLDAINESPRTGVAALIEAAGLLGKKITSGNIAFQLAPRLNAGGRLGSAERSLKLVTAEDGREARALAEELEKENTERRTVEQRILAEAEAQLVDFDFLRRRAIILSGADWNPGVIGLAASRLVEQYHYPVILLSDQGDKLTGSCRSIEGVDIFAALTGCGEFLEKFGGHRQAAGLTLLPENLESFRDAMDAWLRANVEADAWIPVEAYDGELEFEAVTTGLVSALDALQPTGFGNPAPVFRAKCEVVEARAVGAEGAHLKLTLAQGGHRLGGIAFREGHRAEGLSGEVDALFAPKLNTFLGRTEAQLEVRVLGDGDPMARLASKLGEEAALQCDFLTEILYNKKIDPLEAQPAEIDGGTLAGWMGERPQGTLAIACEVAAARRLLKLLEPFEPDLYIGRFPEDPRAFNAVCLCPVGKLPKGYRRIALAGAPGECLPGTDAEVFRLPEEAAWRRQLPGLDELREAYKGFMRVGRRPVWCQTIGQLSRLVAEESGLSDLAACASVLAMLDMGLFEIDWNTRPMGLRRLEKAKAAPEASWVWNAILRWREE